MEHINLFRPVRAALILVLLMVPGATSAQSLEWARSAGGTLQEIAFAVAVDAEASVITTGSFTLTADMDPGAGVSNLTSNGSSDVFVQKLDVDGNFLWARAIGAGGADQGLGVAVDALGNVLVTGKVSGTVDLDPTDGVFTVTSANTSFDVFVIKLDPNGNFLWGRLFGGNSNDAGNGIAVDADGNVHTTGVIGAVADLDPGAGVSNAGGNGGQDIFVQKMDANGDLLWGGAVGGSGNDIGWAIGLRGNGEVHITGEFRGTADMDRGAGVLSLVSAGDADMFALKLSASGGFVWAKRIGGTSFERARSIAVDLAGATVYTGALNSPSDMDPGPGVFNLAGAFNEPAYVLKLDANGDFVWAFLLNGFLCEGLGIRTGNQNELYVTGFFGGTMDIDPGAGTTNIVGLGGSDMFLLSYSASGNLLWGSGIGSAQNDISNAVALGPASKIHICGEFRQTIDMDPGSGVTLLGPVGGQDAFTAKYGKPTCAGVSVAAKMFLEGAYTGDFIPMHDLLRTGGLLPLDDPYRAMGFWLDDTTATTAAALQWSGTNAIVDWVLVELRDANVPSVVLRRRAALLQRDGDIVEQDGVSPIRFCVAEGNYHVAVRHRNHLGVMTAGPQALSASPLVIDLRNAATPTFGSEARKPVNGAMVLWAGNVMPNGQLSYTNTDNDRDPILTAIGGVVPTAVLSGYRNEDVNMDGIVMYTGGNNDRDIILVNIGGTTPTGTRPQQLP
jgi:hypothetical protein